MKQRQDRGVFGELVGDGTPLLLLTGLCLVFAGAFALFLCATGEFLPQDAAFLGMSASELCGYYDGRVLDFMFHDRAAFGGSIIAVGCIYMWLAYYPLRDREPWAWWVFVISGLLGFGSFLAYLGYGYLDTWHGVATLCLLPVYVAGLVASRLQFGKAWQGITCVLKRPDKGKLCLGEILLLMTGFGMMAGGMTILVLGSTLVFVPQDLAFIQASREELEAVSDRLIPLIAHDRAGFGGGIATTGLVVLIATWAGKASLSRWQTFFIAGTTGFVCAIGVHYIIGYTDITHLAPAWLGFLLFLFAMALHYQELFQQSLESESSLDPAVGEESR